MCITTLRSYIFSMFQEISFIGYQVMAEDEIFFLKFRQSKGDDYSITKTTLMKLHVHNHTMYMVIYNQYKFHEIPSISYLVMAEDGKYH